MGVMHRRLYRSSFCLAAASALIFLSCSARAGTVYSTDFTAGAGPEWSIPSTDISPSGQKFLGRFSNSANTLTLTNLPPHTTIQISYDLYVIQSWDGSAPNAGADSWDATVVGGPALIHTTFGNTGYLGQAYPGAWPGANYPAKSGATFVDELGYDNYGNATYHMNFTIPHTASSIAIQFTGSNLEAVSNESWGLDNVQIATANDPAPNQVTFGDFEWPADPSDTIYSAGTTFGDWTVASGDIDHAGITNWIAADGKETIDLNGYGPGTIHQDIPTISGQAYTLSFAMAGNPDCAPTVKLMQVLWDGVPVAAPSFDTSGRSEAAMGWTQKQYIVTGHPGLSQTRLAFRSLTSGACGATIDSVSVTQRPDNAMPASLEFTAQPGGAVSGRLFTQQPVVTAKTSAGQVMTDYNGPITLAIQAGAGTSGAVLGGPALIYATNGVATYGGLSIDRPGTGYVLTAVAGPASGASAAFAVGTAPGTLSAVPIALTGFNADIVTDANVSRRFAQPADRGRAAWVEAGAVDDGGKLHTDGLPPGEFTSASVNTVNGVHTLFALQPFQGSNALQLHYPDRNTAALTLASPAQYRSLAILASGTNTNSTAEGSVILNFADGTHSDPLIYAAYNWGTTGPATAIGNIGRSNDVGYTGRAYVYDRSVPFGLYETDLDLRALGLDTKTLASLTFSGQTQSDSTYDSTTFTNIFAVSGVIAGGAPQKGLIFTTQPQGGGLGHPLSVQPALTIKDDTGATVTGYTDLVTLAIQPGTGTPGAKLVGTASAAPVNGVVTFTGLSIDTPGTGYVLVATGNGLISALSASVDIAPPPPAAQRVYGQADFVSAFPNDGGVSPTSLAQPWAVTEDLSGLFVADSFNNRVVFYPANITTAIRVFGQPNFTSGAANNGGVSKASFNTPAGLALYQRGLYVADAYNNRILYFDPSTVLARRAYGQLSLTANTTPTVVSATTLRDPEGVAVDATGVYVVDSGDNFGTPFNRVLFYPTGSTTATRAYGQPGFTTRTANNGGLSASSLAHPQGIALGPDGVYIADRDNNRVLFYPGTSTTATRVYGQPDFTSNAANNGGIGPRSLMAPYSVAVAPDGVYIADSGNNRVLFFAGKSTTASAVYGQADYFGSIPNQNGVSATTLNGPRGVAFGPWGLVVADYGNHRVLGYSAPAGAPVRYGDVNGDGSVDVSDVVSILDALAGFTTDVPFTTADVGPGYGQQGFSDGVIDLRDATRLLRHLDGLDSLPPWS